MAKADRQKHLYSLVYNAISYFFFTYRMFFFLFSMPSSLSMIRKKSTRKILLIREALLQFNAPLLVKYSSRVYLRFIQPLYDFTQKNNNNVFRKKRREVRIMSRNDF